MLYCLIETVFKMFSKQCLGIKVVLPRECALYKWFSGWADPEGRLAGCGLHSFIVLFLIVKRGYGRDE